MQDRGPNTRVGILGGTSIRSTSVTSKRRCCAGALSLSTILVMPSRIPPHRTHGPAASMFHRFAMASLAVQSLVTWWCATTSCREDGPSYTALTLERLSQRGLTAGSDVLHHRRRRLRGDRNLAPLSAGPRPGALRRRSRPGMTAATAVERVPGLSERLQPTASCAVPSRPSIFAVEARTPDVSSTDVRRRLRAGQSISGLVPPAVEAHILRHRLCVEPQAANISNED